MYLAGMSTMTTDAPTAVREQRGAYVATEPAPSPKSVPAPQGPILWRCDVATFEKMIELGLFPEDFEGELLDGLICESMPLGTPHAYTTGVVRDFLKDRLDERYAAESEFPIVLPDDSRPTPDIWVAKGPRSNYKVNSPRPADLYLVVEVADSSLGIDRVKKLSIYARAAIPEYWIVNLVDQQLERHRGPREDGTYDQKEVLRFGESFESEVWGKVEVTQLFG